MTLNTVLRNVQGIGNTTQGIVDVANRLTGGSYWAQLRPASYRGIGFGVFGGQARVGRRNAVHEYPFRDTPWVEDLGRAARRIHLTGFLVGDDVIAQRDRLLRACETPDDGKAELVHPTLGRRTVALLDFSTEERWDQGRVFEITFTFVEQGQRLFPSSSANTTAAVGTGADAVDLSAAQTFARNAFDALKRGAAVVNEAAKAASAWAAVAIQSGNDATSLLRLGVSLPGEFGRLLGLASGVTVGQVVASVAGQTIQGLTGKAAVSRASISTSASSLQTAAASLSSERTDDFTAAAQALAATVLAATPTPGDGVRAMARMAAFVPGSSASGPGATVRDLSADLFRRAAVVAMTRAAAQYQPESSDDAVAVRNQVLALLDAEITTAGDQGDDDVYTALRAQRAAVVVDLNAKGAALPTLRRVETPRPMPALVLAQRLYRDPSRSDDLVARAAAVHPAFMPVSFQALNA